MTITLFHVFPALTGSSNGDDTDALSKRVLIQDIIFAYRLTNGRFCKDPSISCASQYGISLKQNSTKNTHRKHLKGTKLLNLNEDEIPTIKQKIDALNRRAIHGFPLTHD